MRSMILFLLATATALGIGALAATGQGDERTDLISRIKEIEQLLEKRVARERVPQDKFVIRRFYDVSALIAKVRDEVGRPSNLTVSKFSPPEAPESPEPTAHFEIDSLMELIRMTVEPATWDEVEGADIQPRNALLIVSSIPRVHQGIKRLLDRLRKHARRRVIVDVIVVPVDNETAALLGQRPRELSPAEATAVAALAPLGTARMTCFDGHQSVHRSGSTVSYLQDYDVEIAQKSAIGDPIRAEVFSGCTAEVRACFDAGANGVVLHCRLELTNVLKPMRTMKTEHGPVDLPVMEITRVNTSLWAPLNTMVVIGGTTRGSKPCVFVATVKLVE